MSSQFPGAVPEIPVTKLDDATAYYRDCLGFSVDWYEEQLGLAGISKGKCRMFLANEEFRKVYRNVGPILIWLNVTSKEEVDELYRVWNASKAKIISTPESKPWGLHE